MNLRRLARQLRTFGKRNPTADFSRQSSVPRLQYDVAAAALNGISYSSTVKDLEIFGLPSEVYPLGVPDFMQVQYDAEGLEITLDAEGVVSFELSFDYAERLSLGAVVPCKALIIQNSERMALVESWTDSESLDSLLGPAYDRFNLSSGSLCSQYTLNGSHFVACHSKDGHQLLRLEISEAASTTLGRAGPN